ncbi:MAG: class II fructose-bisphosphate aldolase [Clostridia bacterium]|nr:class II fructose-bisphosphate aldolase [Clostridia bacterium]
MALVSSYDLMKNAKNFAIPAFNIDNLEGAIAVAEVIRNLRTPVIIQTIPRTLNYGGIATYPAMIKALMSDCSVDYAIHLDHGNSYDLVTQCANCGFSSVMIDGSALSLKENILLTKKVVDYAFPLNISVEGELGIIGGKEENEFEAEARYTKVGEAVEFVEATNVSSLAIGVGTAHGVYIGTPVINIKRIAEIHAAIKTPLVLHGASGLSDTTVSDCIAAGITKINFATELRQAFTKGLRTALNKDAEVYDPKLYMRDAIDAIKEVLHSKIRLCYKLNK